MKITKLLTAMVLLAASTLQGARAQVYNQIIYNDACSTGWMISSATFNFVQCDADFDYALGGTVTLGGAATISTPSATPLTLTPATGVVVGAPTGGAKGGGSLNVQACYVNGVACATGGGLVTGTFTATLSGMSTTVTGTINYSIAGNIVTLWAVSAITGTSNTTNMTMTGMPAAIMQSGSNLAFGTCFAFEDNGSDILGFLVTTSASSWSIAVAEPAISIGPTGRIERNAGAWTASGGKGIDAGWTCTYPIF